MVIRLQKLKLVMMIICCIIVIAMLIINYNSILKIFYPLHYKKAIFTYADEYNLDPYLVAAIIKVESKFNEDAISERGARGLMQIMPSTGEWIAGELGIEDFNPDLLYGPKLNINLGSWYLAHLKKIFSNDLTLVIAAYNGGQGNVNRWLELKQWSGRHRDSDQIPFPETRAYVKKVTKTYQRYRKIYQSE
ncbi:soluble lytic murein transglycosylase [Selenihalanaerobacter shriftii]|uniref:Soluble lytic murein transglycosylase n=1 Tax=Selenihalanaerobacter shriftii TaxID=142842 RepID=A0A1T4KCC8_9FIRM|nr:soluble lytic murein transglycosylase [Selenihalanaerobacter shriftii]